MRRYAEVPVAAALQDRGHQRRRLSARQDLLPDREGHGGAARHPGAGRRSDRRVRLLRGHGLARVRRRPAPAGRARRRTASSRRSAPSASPTSTSGRPRCSSSRCGSAASSSTPTAWPRRERRAHRRRDDRLGRRPRSRRASRARAIRGVAVIPEGPYVVPGPSAGGLSPGADGGAAHIHLDPLGGIAGDMFLAALLDACPELASRHVRAMRAAGLPGDWRAELVAHATACSPAAGSRSRRRPARRQHAPPALSRHPRRGLAEAPLPAAVRERALAIFAPARRGRGRVHGVAVDEVHFHELADWDSIADVVAAACLIEALGAAPGRRRRCRSAAAGSRPRTARCRCRRRPPRCCSRACRCIDDGVAGRAGDADRRRDPAPSRAGRRGCRPAPWRLAATGHRLRHAAPARAQQRAARAGLRAGGAGGRRDEPGRGRSRSRSTTRPPEDLAVGARSRCARATACSTWSRSPAFGKKGRLADAGAGAGAAGAAGRGDRALLRRDHHDRPALAASRRARCWRARRSRRGAERRRSRSSSSTRPDGERPPRPRSTTLRAGRAVMRRARAGGGRPSAGALDESEDERDATEREAALRCRCSTDSARSRSRSAAASTA